MRRWIPWLVCLFVVGCATAPDVRWAQATSSFTAAVNALNALREPCVDTALYPDAGPDHPLCRIDDDIWGQGVLPLVREGRTVIIDADTAIQADQTQTVEWAIERVLAIVERLLLIKAMSEGEAS